MTGIGTTARATVATAMLALSCSKNEAALPLPAPSPSAARLASEQARRESEAANAAARKGISAEWAKYDALPAKSKEALISTLRECLRLARGVAEPEAQTVVSEARAASRERMAPLVRPESAATGPERTTLVPARDAAKCRLWGAMWANDVNTAESLASLGFNAIQCGTRVWTVEVASIANRGVVTKGGVMVFKSMAEYDETIECIRTFRPGNPEAEAQAREFEDPAKAIDQLRALCMLGAAPDGKFLSVGSKVLVIDRSGRLVKVKVIGGEEAGRTFYAPPDSVGG
jgi:hypothetical protein